MRDQKLWGGKRVNQTGRPKLPEKLKRVYTTMRIKPETKEYLQSHDQGMGKCVDALVVRAKAKKI
jgi:hypothetical protein